MPAPDYGIVLGKMYIKLREISRKIEEYVTLIFSSLISSIRYRRRDLNSADIRRIVIIKLDHIGDLILSIPAVANLRAHFPQAHIAMVVSSASEQVARYIPYVDEVLCYDARFFDRSGDSKAFDFARGMRFAREMRDRDFDLIVDLRGSFASLLFALIARSKYRIDRGTYLIQRKLGKISPESEHEAEVSLDILAQAGLPIRSRRMSMSLSEVDIDSAHLLLRKAGEVSSLCPIAVIHPGVPSALKSWSIEKYVQLADRLMQDYNAQIVLVGGKGEEQVAQSIISLMNGEAINLSGQTTLGQLAAVLQKADLFVGSDSGPMHLAAAYGTKVIGLYGPTSPQRFGPYGDRCLALRMESDCPPCMKGECKRRGYKCIDRISVDNVMEAVKQIWYNTNKVIEPSGKGGAR